MNTNNALKLSPLILLLLVTLLAGTVAGCTGPDCEDHDDPGAQLSITPDPADLYERVKFDATGSYDHDGRIEKYLFDFDNDGVYDKSSTDGVVYKRFKDSGSKEAKVKVIDNDRLSSTAVKSYRIEDSAGSCRMISGFLNLDDSRIMEGESTQASIHAYNYGREQKVRVTFKVDGVTVSESTKTVGKEGNERFSTSVSPSEDARVKAIVDTIGGPCGDEEINQDYEDLRVETVPEDAHLSVFVVDQDGNPIEDARVSLQEHRDSLRYTNADGRAEFELRPGHYRIEVSKDRYTTYTNSISLDEGERETLRVQIRDKNQEAELRVKTVDKTGDSLRNTRITVKNGEEHSKYTDFDGESFFSLESGTYEVTAYKSGYGIKQRTLELDSGESHSTTFELSSQSSDTENAKLRVHVEDDTGHNLEDARVEVTNGDTDVGHTNRYGDTDFSLTPDTYQVRVMKQGYSAEERTVHLSEGDDRTLNFRLEDRDTEAATLDVRVEDQNGRSLENARVEISDGVNREKRTNSRGRTQFLLPADRYRITASKSGYTTEERSVSLYRGQERSVTLELRETDQTSGHLNIDQISYSYNICRGDDLPVRIRISNSADKSQRVSIGVKGLGDETVDRIRLDSGESRSGTLTLNDVQGSGSETMRIAITNGNTHIETRTVNVQDCNNGGSDPGDGDDDTASAVSMQVTPQEIQIGEMVRVSGYVDGVQGRADVTIISSGRRVANVATEPDGHYSAYIRPQNTGNVEIAAQSSGRTARQQINVLPTVTVSSMEAPRKVFENDQFRICANIESQVTPMVILKRDGERIDSKNNEDRVCFITEAQNPGEAEYTVRASAKGISDSINRRIEILEMGDEVTNFPDKVAMVRSGEGIVRVSLYNTHDGSRRYNLELDGVPDDWFARTQETVILQSGERESVYFYITPKAEGTFYPELTVEADGDQIHQQEIKVSSGGTLKSGKSWKDKILDLLRW